MTYFTLHNLISGLIGDYIITLFLLAQLKRPDNSLHSCHSILPIILTVIIWMFTITPLIRF